MWDLTVSVPDHCLSFYFPCVQRVIRIQNIFLAEISYKIRTQKETIFVSSQFLLSLCLQLNIYLWHVFKSFQKQKLLLKYLDNTIWAPS